MGVTILSRTPSGCNAAANHQCTTMIICTFNLQYIQLQCKNDDKKRKMFERNKTRKWLTSFVSHFHVATAHKKSTAAEVRPSLTRAINSLARPRRLVTPCTSTVGFCRPVLSGLAGHSVTDLLRNTIIWVTCRGVPKFY
jgi:hypothetical protein